MKGLRGFVDWPLRAKLAALIVVASLLPLCIASLIGIRDSRERVLAQSVAVLEARADQLAGQLDTLNETFRGAADRIAHVPDALPSAHAPQELTALLSVMPSRDQRVVSVAMVEVSGTVRAASDPKLLGMALSQFDFVRSALSGTASISDVHVPETGVAAFPVIAFSAPARGPGGEITGAAVLWIRASALWDIMKASNGLAGTGTYASLIDAHGVRVAHSYRDVNVFHPAAKLEDATIDQQVAERRFGPHTRELLEDVRPFPEQFRRATAAVPDPSVFRGYASVNEQVNYGIGKRLRTVPWTLFYMIPERTVYAAVTRTTRAQILLAAAITLLALLTGIAFAASIAKPIDALAGASRQIAAGNLAARVPDGRADEIGVLGQSFNRMAMRIESQAAELRCARDELEARVKARTDELVRTAENLQAEMAERTRAQDELRSSQSLLRGIVESSDDAIISKSLDGIITSWNPGAERLFGYRAEDAIGQPMHIIIPPERADEEPAILARIARGERVHHFETLRVRADGTPVEISATISPLRDGGGRIIGASKIARDITGRKIQESKLHSQLRRLNLLHQITRAIGERLDIASISSVVVGTLEQELGIDFGALFVYSPPAEHLIVGCIGAASRDLARMMGLAERAQVPIDANGLARCVRGELVYEPDISLVPHAFPRRLAAAGLRSLVVAPLSAESRVFGVLIAARKATHAFTSGECEFLLQVAEHTALAAQQAQLVEALQAAYEDLRQTQQSVMQQERLRVLGQMASGIAHDINNAISPVTLYTEYLLDREPNLSATTRDHLLTIQQAVSDVAETVARMREFYREREPQSALSPVQLNALAGQVIELTRARWHDMALEKGIMIQVAAQLESSLPEVLGVESELREALTNLVFNAVDAMPEGGVLSVRTRLRCADAAGPTQDTALLEVVDTGLGMDEQTRRRCLEPFYTTKGERGTGLGLAMVYGTVKRHGADIEIDSIPGQGTTIRLSFPVPRTKTAGGAGPPSPAAPLPPLRLLIVDDDPVLLDSLREVLAADGHRVVIANGGQRGIDAFRSAHERNEGFDVVITDLGMPYIDGRKVAAEVKTIAPSVPVILLTGWGRRMAADGEVPPHVDCVLGKPPRLAQLREAIGAVLAVGGVSG